MILNNIDNTEKLQNMEVDYVIKRDGNREEMQFDKILKRIKNLSDGLKVNPSRVTQKVCSMIYPNINTSELDELAGQVCSSLATEHHDYGLLASRIIVSNHHKNTSPSFSETIAKLYNAGLINNDLKNMVDTHANKLNDVIDYQRDYLIDYFGFKTLEKSYLMRINKVLVERPQHLFLRVALAINIGDLRGAIDTYDLCSKKYYTHATPTLYNAGTQRQQLSSCFLLSMKDDSIDGIFATLKDCAMISKWAGGIGLHIHNVRAKNSHIQGTNGISNGIVPMLRVFNNTARYVDQGGGKRNGSIAIYIEPWHRDIMDFLLLRKNHGNEEDRARDLFYAIWMPDLFMKRVEVDGDWHLFCPNECPGLADLVGSEFEAKFKEYEASGKGTPVKARDIWYAILESQIETGNPYICYKDASNLKSNQQNLGVIKSSNLCTEIVEYSSSTESAVCNLASIGLSNFVEEKKQEFNFKLVRVNSVNNCKYCRMTKELLKSKNIAFEENLIETDEEKRAFMDELNANENRDESNRVKTFPQIYIDDERLGGYQDINEKLRTIYEFNYKKLYEVTKVVTKNLDKVIDINFYPIPETKRSNTLHRPIGIGVQGLADVFAVLEIPFGSEEAAKVNQNIFETIYFGAMEKSMQLAKMRGELLKSLKKFEAFVSNPNLELAESKRASTNNEISALRKSLNPMEEELNREEFLGSYSSFIGSPLSEGYFQFDLWDDKKQADTSGFLWNWNNLRDSVSKYGVRNSLLVAPMPTASTSQILGNNECIEPFTSNIYLRRTLAGEFVVVNKYLMKRLINLNIWNEDLKNEIIKNNGSIQNIDCIPNDVKEVFKTVWEIGNKPLIDMAASRGRFICQSQSLNLFMDKPDFRKLSSMHFYSWKKGLKTGIYYLRTKPVAQAQQFTIEPDKKKKTNAVQACSIDNQECEACGS